jgi:glutamyl/glutaminyl-tRNA synthetase
MNYISLLGWNPKTTEEIFSLDDLIEKFKLEDVHKAGAVFDIERLDWFNSRYMTNYQSDTLYNKLITYLKRYDSDFATQVESHPREYNLKILDELKTRIKKLSDYKEFTMFLYGDTKKYEQGLFLNPKMKIESEDDIRSSLEIALQVLSDNKLDTQSPENIKQTFISAISSADKKNGQILWPVRVALSMQQFSPGALELVYILGKEKSIQRIEKVLNEIS